jgi:hypothetical protein
MSVDELLAGKEEKIETDMWATIRAMEELVALLGDLESHARRHGRTQIGGPHDERIAQARDHIRRMRQIVEEKRPVDLTIAGDVAGGNGRSGVPTGR